MKQEHQVESLSNCISELQQQTHAQRLEVQDTHNTDLLNLDENKFVYNKKIVYEGKSSPKYSNRKRDDKQVNEVWAR